MFSIATASGLSEKFVENGENQNTRPKLEDKLNVTLLEATDFQQTVLP